MSKTGYFDRADKTTWIEGRMKKTDDTTMKWCEKCKKWHKVWVVQTVCPTCNETLRES